MEKNTLNNASGVMKWIEDIVQLINKYGVFKMVFGVIFMVFIAYATYIALNPDVMFEKYEEYITRTHTESLEYRLNATPAIQANLDALVSEARAYRAFIIEMHNGKNNATGLSFIYGSLNYESLSDSACSIVEDYTDISLERYPLTSIVYNAGYWCGTSDELMELDKRFAYRLKSNDADYLAMTVIYGSEAEIGFLGISYNTGCPDMESQKIEKILSKYASKISPLLDNKARKKN